MAVTFEVNYMDPQNHICHVRCNPNDEKPTNVGANSDCLELDEETGETKLYFFNAKTKDWYEAL